MDLSLTEIQELFRDSVQRFVQGEYDFEFRTRRLNGGADPDKLWAQFAELGWLGLGVSEEDGGLGGGLIEQALVQEEFGRGLVVEPYLGSLILPARILAHTGAAVRRGTLPAMVGGEARLAVAWAETQGRYDPAEVTVRAEGTGGGYTITGQKILCNGGARADQLIVSARTGEGVALFLVPANAEGVSRSTFVGFDGVDYADVILNGVQVGSEAMIVAPDRALAVLEEALDHARVAYCAALVGGMAAAVEMTTAYVKVRKQFGSRLADCQVVQHRLVDMLIMTEQSRSILLGGLAAIDGDAGQRKCAVSGCMVHVLEAMRKVAGLAVHQHGGIGLTRELAVGHYYRLSLVADKLLGDVDYHLARFTELEFAEA